MLDIRDLGAESGCKCTEAIQKTIDMCEAGGTVYVPKGEYISGALFLKSDITLYIEKGARLIGSGDISD